MVYTIRNNGGSRDIFDENGVKHFIARQSDFQTSNEGLVRNAKKLPFISVTPEVEEVKRAKKLT